MATTTGRLSFPYFYDPAFNAPMRAVAQEFAADLRQEAAKATAARPSRWDKLDPREFIGTPYGEYLIAKVGKVFPELASGLP